MNKYYIRVEHKGIIIARHNIEAVDEYAAELKLYKMFPDYKNKHYGIIVEGTWK